MNQEGWYSLMRGILFQAGIDTLYVPLNTQNFDNKKSIKDEIFGCHLISYGVFSMFNAKKVHDKKSPFNKGQRKVITSIFFG